LSDLQGYHVFTNSAVKKGYSGTSIITRIKPIDVRSDIGIGEHDIDIARPKPNYNKSAGYTQKEIDGIDNLVAAGYVDTFRHLNPETVKYSWWSYRAGARERNVGWRLDYFFVSQKLKEQISNAEIHNDIHGSDHCPVSLKLSTT
jgi:exodeoxyribonuclease-3